jgi:hypothetical protein
VKPGQRIDPLIHYAGRVEVNFTGTPGKTALSDLKPFVDRAAKTVRSSMRELSLDYEKGLLVINAPLAQGASGNLLAAGPLTLGDCRVESAMDNGHIILVSLDGEPLRSSKRMLLQVMSEEKASGFATEDVGGGLKKITNIGRDPWRVKNLQGSVKFTSGAAIKTQPLDFNGYPSGAAQSTVDLTLAQTTIYYLLTR